MSAPLRPRPHRLPLTTQLTSTLLRAPLFLAATAAFGSASLLASLVEKDGRLQHRIAHSWARVSMACAGSRITVLGEPNLRACPVAVYCSNHLSYMDTPAIFASLPFQFRIVARSNLWQVPFIGWHLNRSGQIPVNVENPRASIASLGGGVKTLREGMPVFVFPEGGRTRDGRPGTFMNGPAFMAIRARVPLVPMALIGTYELLPMHTKQFYPGPVLLAVGEPIDTSAYSPRDVEALTQHPATVTADLFYRHAA
ncbi:MAG TPA: lysophospholipid acyltransferase family protein, partial [Acidobacteriaceae bacterium]